MSKTTVIGFLGSTLDASKRDASRWSKWRPTVGLCMQPDLRVDRLVLLHGAQHESLAQYIAEDIAAVSPETVFEPHAISFDDAWDFEEVYTELLDFAQDFDFEPESEDYLVHITTGTHVAQICLFLLTEARFIPGKLLQTQPKRGKPEPSGVWNAIDLDLSRYDSIARRFAEGSRTSTSFLKGGIETRNVRFNTMIDEIEQVASRSSAPLLLMGPTGAGKSLLARRIYELKVDRRRLSGPLVEVNCATLTGDSAMSALFGHRKGAFTGAIAERDGLLRRADGGLLFLDEIGELGLDEQAMILRAVEEGRFLPVGSDKEAWSSFQLIAGTNRDLVAAVGEGRFRDDLFARLNLWTFDLPGLADRVEDIEPNVDFELDRFASAEDTRVTFNREARERYLAFAASPATAWRGNFRDLSASITRMATLSPDGRIDRRTVDAEIGRLEKLWSGSSSRKSEDDLLLVLPAEEIGELDPFDRAQLAEVIATCRRCRTLSAAGRELFAASRLRRKSTNDADRLRKYLARFGLSWDDFG
ncbi:sigma 54-interacting transcriptional regulator [Altererythrobacter sp. SALINAS58]|uniref:RNA repair transcriptional activator RtcR n=1 Tax=Alteripontixanthobacter muriae TaxID=2705546 RepID=UPI0015751242|nr:RNA repair transcriptional activator RtcR [Alteripontixanthobacter muriae]NTZ43996.1 sigma 54-interacting transcriptional regulator [Alteripontixanthobacter muriae]